MYDLYVTQGGRLERVPRDSAPPDGVVWVDLLHPTPDEEDRVEKILGIDVPTREEMSEIEVSSRLYRENEALYMTASILVDAEGESPNACPITFILTKDRLVTVRYSEPSVFKTFPKQAQKAETTLRTAGSVFASLLEAVIDRTADILEKVGAEADALSRSIFQNQGGRNASRDYKAVLRQIGRNGDLNSKARESLVTIGRLLNFLGAECADLHPRLREHTDTMQADIRSLADYAAYVSNTTVFLLDATLGLIGIEQNDVIRILSVVSTVIMPPMLIASIYGMNFHNMPELGTRFGYPVALLAMVVTAVVPYLYFKRRGWL